jgi:3-dehydroquinate dehydratase / shikimate dehydrogenase
MVAVLGGPPRPDASELRALSARADAIEVRADLCGDLDPRWLRQHFSGSLIYTLRSVEQGGQCSGDLAHRHARLQAAARAYDQIDLEWPTDLSVEMLAAVPPERRRLYRHVRRHGVAADLDTLISLLDSMSRTPAAQYMITVDAASAEDAIAVVSLLASADRTDLVAHAMGPAGSWTRILAPRLGAPIVFGQAGTSGHDGMPTLSQLRNDYGLPELGPIECLYGMVGRSPGRSASPRLHNCAYRMLGLPALYLTFPTDDLERFWRTFIPALDAARLPLRGLTIIAPFKERILNLVDRTSAAAARCGAANIAWRDRDGWAADTTDTAVVSALVTLGIDPNGHRTAVVGCGAAGRSVAAALALAGADVCLVNRGHDRGRLAERLLGLPFVPLADFNPVGFTLVVHATPVTDRVPIPLTGLSTNASVIELVYADSTTPFIDEASARGMFTADGWHVLAAEVPLQFQIMTGLTMPSGVPFDPPVPFRAVAHPRMEESR